MAATKAQKELARMRARASSRRAKVKAERDQWTRRLTLMGTGYAVGSLVKTGRIDSIPRLFGMPRTLTLGILATLGADYVGGRGGAVLEGVGEGSLAIAAFQFGSGQEVAGIGEGPAQLESQLQDELAYLAEQEAEEEAA